MDPKQTLLDIEAAIESQDRETAEELMNAYQNWRNRGGFQPKIHHCGGDLFYHILTERFQETFPRIK